jgi:hypothetical protein
VLTPLLEFWHAGAVAYLIVLCTLCFGVGALVLAALSARRRMPFALWCAGPLLLLALGRIGTAVALLGAVTASSAASPGLRSAVAGAGLAEGMLSEGLGAYAAVPILGLSAWLAALVSMATLGVRRRLGAHTKAAVGAGALVVLGGMAGLIRFALLDHGSSLAPLVLLLVGPAVACAALIEDDESGRATHALLVSTLTLLMSLVAVTWAAWASFVAQGAHFGARAAPESRDMLVGLAQMGAQDALLAGGGTLAVALVAAGMVLGARLTSLSMGRLGAEGLTLLVAVVCVSATGLPRNALRSELQGIVDATVGFHASATLEIPVASVTNRLRARRVDVVLSTKDLLYRSRWLLDLELEADEATGEPRLVLAALDLKDERVVPLDRIMDAQPVGDVVLLQADRRTPRAVLLPVLRTLEQGGTPVQLLVLTDEGRAAVDLPRTEVLKETSHVDLQRLVTWLESR